MDAISDDSGLRSGQRNSPSSECIDSHGGQRDRGLLAGREEHIHLSFAGMVRHLAR
jgi:hypothetical protein